MIRIAAPSIDEREADAVLRVLRSGLLVQGEQVAAFEDRIAEYVGAAHTVAISSCTAALHISLLALGIQQGDYVIVPSYSFVATANAVELCGAEPVFVDIRQDTFNMDPGALAEILSLLMSSDKAKKVKAILPVHCFGVPADMWEICELAKRYALVIVEDAACALGARLSGRHAGTWGAAGCFSFHPRKAITTGEGGAIVTDDVRLADRLRALRNHGQPIVGSPNDSIIPGFNYRMSELQASLGNSQFARIDRIIDARRRAAALYDELLMNTEFTAPHHTCDSEHVYQSYTILLPNEVADRRPALIAQLHERGIETTIGTWHMPLTSYFKYRYGYKMGDFPVTDDIARRSLSLPLYPQLRASEQEYVVNSLNAVLQLASNKVLS
jgi:perosamine synthetase